jgi:hypothetical protein
MSGTPETDDIARGNHVVPTEWAEQLERQRDEARKMSERPTPETDAKASPHIGFFSCATVPAEFARKLERERNDAREKYATEATEHMLAVNRICNERDDAREEARLLKAILDLIKKGAQ